MSQAHSQHECTQESKPTFSDHLFYPWAINITKQIELFLDGKPFKCDTRGLSFKKNCLFQGGELRVGLLEVVVSDLEGLNKEILIYKGRTGKGKEKYELEIKMINMDLKKFECLKGVTEIKAFLKELEQLDDWKALDDTEVNHLTGIIDASKPDIESLLEKREALEFFFFDSYTKTIVKRRKLTKKELECQITQGSATLNAISNIQIVNRALLQKVKCLREELSDFEKFKLRTKLKQVKPKLEKLIKWSDISALDDPDVTNETLITMDTGRPSNIPNVEMYRNFLGHIYNMFSKKIEARTPHMKLIFLLANLHADITLFQNGLVNQKTPEPLSIHRTQSKRNINPKLMGTLTPNTVNEELRKLNNMQTEIKDKFIITLSNLSGIVKRMLELKKLILESQSHFQGEERNVINQLTQLCTVWEKSTLSLIPKSSMIDVKCWFIADIILFFQIKMQRSKEHQIDFSLDEYPLLNDGAVFTSEECLAIASFVKQLKMSDVKSPKDMLAIFKHIKQLNINPENTIFELFNNLKIVFKLPDIHKKEVPKNEGGFFLNLTGITTFLFQGPASDPNTPHTPRKKFKRSASEPPKSGRLKDNNTQDQRRLQRKPNWHG